VVVSKAVDDTDTANGSSSDGRFVWDQEVEVGCYCPPRLGATNKPLLLQAVVSDEGGVMSLRGEEVVGKCTIDITEVVRSREKERLCLDLQGALLNTEVQFVGVGGGSSSSGTTPPPPDTVTKTDGTTSTTTTTTTATTDASSGGSSKGSIDVPLLGGAGVVRVFIMEAMGMRTVEDKQVSSSSSSSSSRVVRWWSWHSLVLHKADVLPLVVVVVVVLVVVMEEKAPPFGQSSRVFFYLLFNFYFFRIHMW